MFVGSARVLPPGELSLAVGGAGRTATVPRGIEQPGPAAGMIELRGGLPLDGLEAGVTLALPWHVGWDLKVRLLPQRGLAPALAARAELGVVQPSWEAGVLASRTAGPVTLTAAAGRGRRHQRLWREGAGPFAQDSENHDGDVYAWGAGIETALSPHNDLFAGVVSWSTRNETEEPRRGPAFGVNVSPGWFVSAGLRIRWRMAKPPAPRGALTALRGYILSEPAEERFEIGQPGIYRATVLLDARTRVLSAGRPAERAELRAGRAVLIQGLALPAPSTFLARVIELQ